MLRKIETLRAKGSEEGFTLIELMIVVVIIGILAAIAIPIFMNQQKAAINAGVKSDVKNINTAIATLLVKHPTADLIGGRLDATQGYLTVGDETIITDENGATYPEWDSSQFELQISDPATVIIVGTGIAAGGGFVSAAWDNYSVVGSNSATEFTAQYDSTTGKLVEVDYINLGSGGKG